MVSGFQDGGLPVEKFSQINNQLKTQCLETPSDPYKLCYERSVESFRAPLLSSCASDHSQ